MEDPHETEPIKFAEITDIPTLVELLHGYSPKEFRSLLKESTTIITIPSNNQDNDAPQFADLSKLCRHLPRHILACLIKDGESYGVQYIIKALKLILHMAKFCKKKGGVLTQQVYLGIPKVIDANMLALVICIQTLASTESVETFDNYLELTKQVFTTLDYYLDSELSSTKQPFMDSMVVHPKLPIFNTAILDILNLILHHRNIFASDLDAGKSKSSLISKTLVAIFDVLDILAMSDAYVSKFVTKSNGSNLVEIWLTIFKDASSLGIPVLFGTLKLINRLCEEEPTFVEAVVNSPSCTRFNLVLNFVIDLASDLQDDSKYSHALRNEAIKILLPVCRETTYRPLIIQKASPFFLKFFSLPPSDFAASLKDSSVAEKSVYILSILGNLHFTQPQDPDEKTFFATVIDLLSQPTSLLWNKAYSQPNGIYTPSFITNINTVLSEILNRPRWREQLSLKISKQQALLVVRFRSDVEKYLNLNSAALDSMFSQQFDAWVEQSTPLDISPAK